MTRGRSVEPRFFPRIDLSIPVSVEVGADRIEAEIENLSEGGALLRGLPPSCAGCPEIRLTFVVPVRPVRVCVRASVVRGDGRGLAVDFIDASEEALDAIRALVEARDPMAWDGGAELPHEVAVRFVPVIRRQAHRLARRVSGAVSADDLVGAGFLALVEASRRFDPSQGASFGAYALVRIRGAMLDELRGADPLSRSLRRTKAQADAAARRLAGDLGRPPDDEEVARCIDLSLDDYRACLRSVSLRRPVPLDDLGDTEGLQSPLGAAASATDIEGAVGRNESLRRIQAAMEALPARLRTVIEMYFEGERTMSDIGSVLGLSEGRVSQLVSDGLRQVRARVTR